MFTKQKYWMNAQKRMTEDEYLNNLKCCLTDVKEQMIINSESQLAMPKIACGLDRCSWTNVKNVIHEVFQNTDFEIFICLF